MIDLARREPSHRAEHSLAGEAFTAPWQPYPGRHRADHDDRCERTLALVDPAACGCRQRAGLPAADPNAVGDRTPPVYVGRGMWHQPAEGVPLIPGRTTP